MTKKATEIGERLKKAIKDKGFTQIEFAKKCGVPKDTLVSHFYSENMSADYIKKYALALEISTDYLLFGEERKLKEDNEDENTIPLKEINKGIVLLMKYFGSNIVEIMKKAYGDKYFQITIFDTRLSEKILKIKKLMELIESDDGSIKEDLEKSIETIVNAENMIVQKVTPENTAIYDKTKEIVYYDKEENRYVIATFEEYTNYLNNNVGEKINEIINEEIPF